MPAYILRFAGTDAFAGLFAAASDWELLALLDEEADPNDYEYAIITGILGVRFLSDGVPAGVEIGNSDEIEEGLSLPSGFAFGFKSEVRVILKAQDKLTWRGIFED